jgi:hypothetical protein
MSPGSAGSNLGMSDISQLLRLQQIIGANKSKGAQVGVNGNVNGNSSKVTLSALSLDLPRGPTAVRTVVVPPVTQRLSLGWRSIPSADGYPRCWQPTGLHETHYISKTRCASHPLLRRSQINAGSSSE